MFIEKYHHGDSIHFRFDLVSAHDSKHNVYDYAWEHKLGVGCMVDIDELGRSVKILVIQVTLENNNYFQTSYACPLE